MEVCGRFNAISDDYCGLTANDRKRFPIIPCKEKFCDNEFSAI